MDERKPTLLEEVRSLQRFIRIVTHRVDGLVARLEACPMTADRDELLAIITRLLEEPHA